MPEKKQDSWQIVSVRLPHELSRRLDRYLDWSEFYRRVKSSRNAAIREALSQWLDDQEQRAGFDVSTIKRSSRQFFSRPCDIIDLL